MQGRRFDAAVIGVGSMGAFTCLELARRGLHVLGIDRFHPPHSHGSHSGETRVYREAYAEHPDYVPLALLAGQLWDRYGTESQQPLLTRCGQLSVGALASDLLAGVLHSAERHGLQVQELGGDELARRFPMIRTQPGDVGLLEPAAGWIDVDNSLRFALNAFSAQGGELRLGTRVLQWKADADGVTILLDKGESIWARRLIVCAGAWASELLPQLDLSLQVCRKVLLWLRPREPFAEAAAQMPVTMYTGKILYTFPARDGLFKCAVHWTDRRAMATDPDHVAGVQDSDLEEALREASNHLQPLFGDYEEARSRVATSKTCLYTMTPDEHFVLDRVADRPVWYAAGFSGHGFKFAPAIGRVMAQMACGDATSAPVDFLRSARLHRKATRQGG